MDRRSLLSLAGGALTAVAGCLAGPDTGSPARTRMEVSGPVQDDDLPPDPDPTDGFPPSFDTTPSEREIDVDGFDTERTDGQDVPLAPADVVYYWYARGEARFADARSETAYGRSHIYGAVLSPAPDGGAADPVADWPRDDLIVCYCGCPHHLSTQRAADLLANGYQSVIVIDEGFWDGWYDREYPIAGDDVQSKPAPWVIDGVTDPSHAGGTAWARHAPTGQREAARIGQDGRFRMVLRFAGVGRDSVLAVETPAYRVEAPLGRLAETTVTAPD